MPFLYIFVKQGRWQIILEAKKGVLYLCATPIGNLEDITARVLRILAEVDLVAAEDTRQTLKLFNRFSIHTPLTSYHQHNQKTKGRQLIEQILDGKNIALVSDAGLPGISDPGEDLVSLALEAEIEVISLPGATASLTALVASGLPTKRFVFEGFLPLKGSLRKELLEELKKEQRTIILYESPHRIKNTLADLLETLGARQATLARELTKKFEEYKRGSLKELLDYAQNPLKGEITLIISGGSKEKDLLNNENSAEAISPEEEVLALEALGTKRNQAIKEIAKKRGLERQELYKKMILLK